MPQVRHPGSDKADPKASSPTLKPPEPSPVCLGRWKVNSRLWQLFSVSFKSPKRKIAHPRYLMSFLIFGVKVEHMGETQCRAN